MKVAAVRVRRNVAVLATVLVSMAVIVGAAIFSSISPADGQGLAGFSFAFVLPLGLAFLAGWSTYWRARRDAVGVDVSGGALSFDKTLVRAAGTLSSGHATVLADGRVRVDLHSRVRERIRLEVKDIAVARELLAALSLDRRAGTSHFRIRRLRSHPNVRVLAGFLAVPFLLVMMATNGSLGLTLFGATLFAVFFEYLRTRANVTVGSDGIEIRSPIKREFFAHAKIRRIERTWPEGHENGSRHQGDIVSWGFELETEDGEVRRFDTRPERFAADVWKTDAMFDAAFEAWQAATSGANSAPAHASALLARGTRTTREWIASLRELAVDGGGGYRVAALDERALFAILADAEASRELRAGAAIALGGREDRTPKLRVAADDVADPVVRRIAVACGDAKAAGELESELDEAFSDDAPNALSLRSR